MTKYAFADKKGGIFLATPKVVKIIAWLDFQVRYLGHFLSTLNLMCKIVTALETSNMAHI